MTKQELINRISEQTGVDVETSGAIMLSFFDLVKASVAQGETIYMRTFGSFGPKQRAQKKARLITAKQTLIVDAHKIPSFKPSRQFIDQVKVRKPV